MIFSSGPLADAPCRHCRIHEASLSIVRRQLSTNMDLNLAANRCKHSERKVEKKVRKDCSFIAEPLLTDDAYK